MWSPIPDKVGGKPSTLPLLDGLVLQVGWDLRDPRGCRKRQGKFCPSGKFQEGHMPIAHLVDHFIQQCGSLTIALETFPWKSLDKSQLGLWSCSFPGPGFDSSLQFPGPHSLPLFQVNIFRLFHYKWGLNKKVLPQEFHSDQENSLKLNKWPVNSWIPGVSHQNKENGPGQPDVTSALKSHHGLASSYVCRCLPHLLAFWKDSITICWTQFLSRMKIWLVSFYETSWLWYQQG